MDKSININATAGFEIKRINRSRIIRLFCQNSALSRRDLQVATNLSLPTISQNISELMETGLIVKSGSITYTGGRNAETFSLNARARLAVGLDITKHHIVLVLVDLLGNIVYVSRTLRPYEKSERYFRYLGELVRNTLKANRIPYNHVIGVGLGIPVLTSIDNTKIVYSKIMDWDGLDANILSEYLGFPVKLYNDANAACQAELHVLDETEQNGFYIMLSTNVGGAIFINHSVYTGNDFRGGEIGHLIIHKDGKPCYCGQKGCLEAYCSANALTSISNNSVDAFFDMLDAGNEEAEHLLDVYLNDLAIAIKSVRILFNSPVIIGGYIGTRIERYIPKLRAILEQHHTFDTNTDYIKVCRFDKKAIAVGSALPAITEFLESF